MILSFDHSGSHPVRWSARKECYLPHQSHLSLEMVIPVRPARSARALKMGALTCPETLERSKCPPQRALVPPACSKSRLELASEPPKRSKQVLKPKYSRAASAPKMGAGWCSSIVQRTREHYSQVLVSATLCSVLPCSAPLGPVCGFSKKCSCK